MMLAYWPGLIYKLEVPVAQVYYAYTVPVYCGTSTACIQISETCNI